MTKIRHLLALTMFVMLSSCGKQETAESTLAQKYGSAQSLAVATFDAQGLLEHAGGHVTDQGVKLPTEILSILDKYGVCDSHMAERLLPLPGVDLTEAVAVVNGEGVALIAASLSDKEAATQWLPTLNPASPPQHNDEWLAYNIDRRISVAINDTELLILRTPRPQTDTLALIADFVQNATQAPLEQWQLDVLTSKEPVLNAVVDMSVLKSAYHLATGRDMSDLTIDGISAKDLQGNYAVIHVGADGADLQADVTWR